MNILDGILLGAIQGVTEFLPISSSGHLILARELFGIATQQGLAVDAVLHFATALAVLLYFWKDVRALLHTAYTLACGGQVAKQDKILLYGIVVATIPAVILGLLLESYMATVFRSALLVAGTLIAGSLLMAGAEWAAARYARGELTLKSSILIGFFQSLALIPGMSRAGMAISGGLFLGLTRTQAARFAFLLALPILLGSGAKKLLELGSNGSFETLGFSLVVSAVTAFVVGLLAVHYLLKYLRNHTLGVFIIYRLVLALCVLVFLL